MKLTITLCHWCLCLLLAAMVFPVAFAQGGTWQVIPIRLDFDQRARSGVITIANNSDEKMSFSVEAMQWTQDSTGKDVYTETTDILYFPKQLTVEPHQERIIRAGIKIPAVKTENTYRLFIKQEPAARDSVGTNVAVVIRFGVPIFSKPLEEQLSGEITRATVKDGKVEVELKNSGNTHFKVSAVQLSGWNANGEQIYTQELNGSYLLAGTTHVFSTPLPQDSCEQIATIDILAASNRLQLNGKTNVDKAACLSP